MTSCSKSYPLTHGVCMHTGYVSQATPIVKTKRLQCPSLIIFIAPPDNQSSSNHIHSYLTAHSCFIVIDRIKGAAPPAFNKTLERVACKQASKNPPLQQHSSKPPSTLYVASSRSRRGWVTRLHPTLKQAPKSDDHVYTSLCYAHAR